MPKDPANQGKWQGCKLHSLSLWSAVLSRAINTPDKPPVCHFTHSIIHPCLVTGTHATQTKYFHYILTSSLSFLRFLFEKSPRKRFVTFWPCKPTTPICCWLPFCWWGCAVQQYNVLPRRMLSIHRPHRRIKKLWLPATLYTGLTGVHWPPSQRMQSCQVGHFQCRHLSVMAQLRTAPEYHICIMLRWATLWRTLRLTAR